MQPIIAIVGRPNVGKSSLFNRMLGKRAAVVDDIPGVTRDRNYRPLAWQEGNYLLVDTGGMMVQEKEMLSRSINAQIRQAIDEAAAVLFIVEAGTGITGDDEILARMLRKQAIKKTILVVNKAESPRARYELDVFRNLGLGEPWPVSALHGKGVADVLDEAVKIAKLNPVTVDEKPVGEQPLRIAIVGRPNVGKSSLVNKLLKQERMIVDDEAGTTRDSIDTEMNWGDRRISLIDTAGLRKKSHVKEDLEYYFNLRAIKSIDRCDVCAVIVNAGDEIGIQDLRIIRKAFELHKGIFVAFNKWDTVQNKGDKTFDHLVADIKCEFLELRPLPMLAISALTGRRVNAIIDTAIAINERMGVRVPSAEFEDTVFTWVRAHPHPAIPSEPVRFLGARQIDAPYPFFRFFVTYPRNISPHYVRYLTNKIYDKYGFEGCPLKLEFKTVLKPGGKRGNESGGAKAEAGGQKSEVRSQRSAAGGQRPAVRGRKKH